LIYFFETGEAEKQAVVFTSRVEKVAEKKSHQLFESRFAQFEFSI